VGVMDAVDGELTAPMLLQFHVKTAQAVAEGVFRFDCCSLLKTPFD